MFEARPLLPRLLSLVAVFCMAGFTPSSSTVVDRECQAGKTVVTARSSDECTKTVTYYGIRALGLCTGKNTKCKTVKISGPCDVILPEEE